MHPPVLAEPAGAASGGFEVRRHVWALDGDHGRVSLALAAERRYVFGPPGTVAYLDTETTGLAGGTGTYVFLIGVAAVEDAAFHLAQFFLRDLRSERAMLEALDGHLRRFEALVTFNGTRFDLPLLQTRFILSRLRLTAPAVHVDLLGVARGLWYRLLGGYSLRLLEQAVLAVERAVDVPGWMIPSLYTHYLRTRDPAPLEPVFAHNAQDLISLLALHGVAGDIVERRERCRVPVDWVGLARLLEARRDEEGAVACFETALRREREVSARRRAASALARHYRRRGNLQAALQVWEREVRAGILPAWEPLERLAMLWEWRLGDPARALALTEEALVSRGDGCPVDRLQLRRDRLLRKGAKGIG